VEWHHNFDGTCKRKQSRGFLERSIGLTKRQTSGERRENFGGAFFLLLPSAISYRLGSVGDEEAKDGAIFADFF